MATDDIKRNTELCHPSGGYGSGFFEWLRVFFVAVVIAGVINTALFQIVLVEQISMHPTLESGTRVYVSRCAYWFDDVQCGDIVVFFNPADEYNYVKRVIGLPGDEIIISDGIVYRNGNPLTEPYIAEITDGEYSIRVPDGEYFCLGDNRNLSTDSRDEYVGCITDSQIVGKVIFKVFPWERIEEYKH